MRTKVQNRFFLRKPQILKVQIDVTKNLHRILSVGLASSDPPGYPLASLVEDSSGRDKVCELKLSFQEKKSRVTLDDTWCLQL